MTQPAIPDLEAMSHQLRRHRKDAQDTEAELAKGWNAARAANFATDLATLKALSGSHAALGGFFAAMHSEGGGAARRDPDQSAADLDAIASRALSPLDFQGGLFGRLVDAALIFADRDWPRAEAATAIAQSAKASRLPDAALVAEICQLNIERPMTQSLKEAGMQIAAELGIDFGGGAPARLSSQTSENLQAMFSRISLDSPETKTGPSAPARSI